MPRKRKVPTAADFIESRERLWKWLVAYAGASDKELKLPGGEPIAIEGEPHSIRRAEAQRINHEGGRVPTEI